MKYINVPTYTHRMIIPWHPHLPTAKGPIPINHIGTNSIVLIHTRPLSGPVLSAQFSWTWQHGHRFTAVVAGHHLQTWTLQGKTWPHLEDHPSGCKWLVTPIYQTFWPFSSTMGNIGEHPYLQDLLAMVLNHLLTGMLLQEQSLVAY